MYAEARYLLQSALRLAEERGARLRGLTIEGKVPPELAAALTDLLSSLAHAHVELRLIQGPKPARLSSVELDDGR